MGVLDHLATARPGGRGAHSAHWSIFVPAQPGPQLLGNYVLRAAPEDLPRVMRAPRETVATVAHSVVLDEEQTANLRPARALFPPRPPHGRTSKPDSHQRRKQECMN